MERKVALLHPAHHLHGMICVNQLSDTPQSDSGKSGPTPFEVEPDEHPAEVEHDVANHNSHSYF